MKTNKSLLALLLAFLFAFFFVSPAFASPYDVDYTGTWIVYESEKDLLAGKKLVNRRLQIHSDGRVDYDVSLQNGPSYVGTGSVELYESPALFHLPDGSTFQDFLNLSEDAMDGNLGFLNFCGLNLAILRKVNASQEKEFLAELAKDTAPLSQSVKATRDGNKIRLEYNATGGKAPYVWDLATSHVRTAYNHGGREFDFLKDLLHTKSATADYIEILIPKDTISMEFSIAIMDAVGRMAYSAVTVKID